MDKTKRLKEETAASFGFEWSHFGDIYDQYESNFLEYVAPLDKEFFKGKRVLDAGCGAGRHAYFLAKYGAEVTAFDLSEDAVEQAKWNVRNMPNTRVMQADIYDLPRLWHGCFDAAISLGVLHHLPDPQDGFRKLVRTVRTGGTVAIWVYGKKDNWMARWLYEPLRKVTVYLPSRLLYYLALLPALAVQAANLLRLPVFRQYARFPFATKWNDAFDMMSAPKAEYYEIEEIRRWFKEAGLRDVVVSYRMMNGKAKGIRGRGTV